VRTSNEGLRFLMSFLEKAAKAALYCAHRTSTFLSCAFCEQEGHLAAPPFIFRLRVARSFPLLLKVMG
jgi:hypothetical protein